MGKILELVSYISYTSDHLCCWTRFECFSKVTLVLGVHSHLVFAFLRDSVLCGEEIWTRRPRGSAEEGVRGWSSQHSACPRQTSPSCQTRSPTDERHDFHPLGRRTVLQANAEPGRLGLNELCAEYNGSVLHRWTRLRPHACDEEDPNSNPSEQRLIVRPRFKDRPSDRDTSGGWRGVGVRDRLEKLFNWSQPEW